LRIGIPNFIPLFGYLFFVAIGIKMPILYFEKLETATSGMTIFIIILILSCSLMIGVLSYRLKFVVMTDNRIIVIMPFRLQYRSLKYDNVVNLKWKLWTTYKMGDYRKLIILTGSGYQINISDLEFINYDRLECWLIDKTNLKLNLSQKLKIELEQAKYNRWLNLLVILFSLFILHIFSTKQNQSDVIVIIQIIIAVIIWRLALRLYQYQQLIAIHKQQRK
jgi:hypothetical protein